MRVPTLESLESRTLLSAGPRQMEYLGRGVVATRSSSTKAFVSWRSFATDAASMTFNVYRSINGGSATKLNSSPLSGGTNYTDSTASNTAAAYSYFVKPVIGGVEQAASGSYTLAANSPSQPMLSLPLRNIGDYHIRHVSVGDLDGDGEYDFIVDRIPNQVGMTERFEAYRRDGTFLWSVDCGPNSLDLDNIEPGSSAIDVGNWDGVTCYDMDGDGKAEVLYRSSNGVVFGDGTTLSNPNENVQYISVINGMTGAERARIQLPTDYLPDGPMAASFGIGYLDGVHPSLVAKMKNRHGSGDFNQMFVAYDFNGTSITQQWKWLTPVGSTDNGHNIRIVDVDGDGDGKDDVADTAQVVNSDGTLKYTMSPAVGHGDRFHIGDLDPDRPGLEGYAVQQNNPSGMTELYYDAGTGEILHAHYTTPLVDVGRGEAGDIDPNHRGYEYWSFYGIYNSATPVAGQPPVETKIASEPNRPWPNFRVWWDGDVLSENLNNTVIDKWNPTTQGTDRVTTLYHYGSPTATDGEAPVFYGDILGDWREEVIFEKSDHTALDIYTTQIASSTRIYALAQDPEYRNCMTVKGYYQSNMVDYYLGDGMATPPTPNITVHAPTSVIVPPAAPTNLAATIGSGGVQVNLNWSAVSGAASYKIRRSTTNGGPYAVVGTATGTSFTDGTITTSGSYYYVVTEINSGGAESTPSNQASLTIGQQGTSNIYQAEDGALSGGVTIDTNASGYTGTGFANFPGNGGVVQWNNVSGGGGGTATLTFRYAQGATGTRTGLLTVNGVSQNVTFSWTGGWNTWETLVISVNVTPSTTNTIKLQSTGQDLANIDRVQVDVAAPPFSYTGGAGGDQYYIRRNGANIDVWVNGNVSGLPTYSLIYASTPSLTFTAGAGSDSLTIDLSGGIPMPAQGISFDGGTETDTLAIVGSPGADTFTFNASSLVIGSTLTQTAVEKRTLDCRGGADTLVINGGAVALAAPMTVANLAVNDGSLDVGNFGLVIDYADDDPIGSWDGSGYTGVTGLIASGSNGGTWDGSGLVTSETLAIAPNSLTTLAVGEAHDLLGLSGSQTALWNGLAVDATTVIVKYTYAGDSNLDGMITGDDYFQIDSAYPTGTHGWLNGDFNYDGIINGDDYFLIDSNFPQQAVVL